MRFSILFQKHSLTLFQHTDPSAARRAPRPPAAELHGRPGREPFDFGDFSCFSFASEFLPRVRVVVSFLFPARVVSFSAHFTEPGAQARRPPRPAPPGPRRPAARRCARRPPAAPAASALDVGPALRRSLRRRLPPHRARRAPYFPFRSLRRPARRYRRDPRARRGQPALWKQPRLGRRPPQLERGRRSLLRALGLLAGRVVLQRRPVAGDCPSLYAGGGLLDGARV